MKKLSLALFLLMPYFASFANPIDESTAKAVAFNFLSSKIPSYKLANATLKLAYKGMETSNTPNATLVSTYLALQMPKALLLFLPMMLCNPYWDIQQKVILILP